MKLLKRAFLSKDQSGKLFSHQYRVGTKILVITLGIYQKKYINDISNWKDFEDIFKSIDKVILKRFGGLAKYDIALRIAFYLNKNNNGNFLPKTIFLYGPGPRKAYKKLFNKRIINNRVSISSFKGAKVENIIIKQKLEPWEIEIILCELSKII